MLKVKDVWVVDKNTYQDLDDNFYVAIRTEDGKTYRTVSGYRYLEEADTVAFRIMDTGMGKENIFGESCPYGIDLY